MKKQKETFQAPKNLTESKTEKPKKGQKAKVWQMQQVSEGTFEAPKELESFQRPETIKLEEIGEFVHGFYEGLQPVNYTSGGIGYLLLLRQGQNPSDKLIAINAGYDIRRWLLESGFDSLIGEYLKVTLDKFVNTGMPAPMKQYKFSYTQNVAKQLQNGAKQTLRQLEAKFDDGVKLIEQAKSAKPFEVEEN